MTNHDTDVRNRPDKSTKNDPSQPSSKKRRVTKAQWLEAGLKALEHGGVHTVHIETLAKSLSVSKSGFYWHFRDREHLLQEIQTYWRNEFNAIVPDSPALAITDARETLRALDAFIREQDLARYDLAFLEWASIDEDIKAMFDEVIELRMNFVRNVMAECGFKGADLEVRAKLFVSFQTINQFIFPPLPKALEENQINAFMDVIAGPINNSRQDTNPTD